MMERAIRDFPKQFEYQPVIENADQLVRADSFIVAGMGGSNHATDLLKAWQPQLDIMVHRNYGLPERIDEQLVIACSYSGNTEELIDTLEVALKEKRPAIAISTGGKLLDIARKHNTPHIVLPDTDIEPRAAVGFMLQALLRIIDEKLLKETQSLVDAIDVDQLEKEGKALASRMRERVPVVYASEANRVLANNWKIRLNETGKIPAYYDVFPELNHNEINAFGTQKASWDPSVLFYILFLSDNDDELRIQRRINVTGKLYNDRNMKTETLELTGASRIEKLMNAIILADWTAYYSALQYNLKPDGAPIVEEFKRLI